MSGCRSSSTILRSRCRAAVPPCPSRHRPAEQDGTQRLHLEPAGQNLVTIRHRHSGRFLDAADTPPDADCSVVTRPSQVDDSQLWVLLPVGPGTFTVQQFRPGRFVDAFGSAPTTAVSRGFSPRQCPDLHCP
jgi:hypothetical protein